MLETIWVVSVAITIITFFIYLLKTEIWIRFAVLMTQALAALLLYLLYQYAAHTQDIVLFFASAIPLTLLIIIMLIELSKLIIEQV